MWLPSRSRLRLRCNQDTTGASCLALVSRLLLRSYRSRLRYDLLTGCDRSRLRSARTEGRPFLTPTPRFAAAILNGAIANTAAIRSASPGRLKATL